MAIPIGLFDKVVERKATTLRTLGNLSGGLKRGQLAVVAGSALPTTTYTTSSNESKLFISLEKDV